MWSPLGRMLASIFMVELERCYTPCLARRLATEDTLTIQFAL